MTFMLGPSILQGTHYLAGYFQARSYPLALSSSRGKSLYSEPWSSIDSIDFRRFNKFPGPLAQVCGALATLGLVRPEVVALARVSSCFNATSTLIA